MKKFSIISGSTLCNIILYQIKKMSASYKVMFGCECQMFDKTIHSYLLSRQDFYKKSKRPNPKYEKQKVCQNGQSHI